MEDTYTMRERMSGAINALSISPDASAVVVAGREILKVFEIKDKGIKEASNLRSGSHYGSNYSSNDVKWGNNATKQKVATAATNGAIIVWDINRNGQKAERVINEHSRAVNRICFQPDNGNLLLSASQDGTMRGWDFREAKNGAARYRFEGKSESVRDIQFNPVNTNEFAAAFETGTVQKWDIRITKNPVDKIVSAHQGPCLTVNWHANGKLVASGGRDKTIKVWEIIADSRRPLCTIRTMAPVSRVQWRPGFENEIASCALLTDSRIHVWDVRRPHIAKYAFDQHDITPTGFMWLNPSELLSVSKDKWLIRQNVKGSYRPFDLLKRNGMGWNVQGDLAFTTDKSSRELFVDEAVVSRPLTNDASSGNKNWKKISTKNATDEEVVQYIPPQSCGIAHMPLFDFEAFSIFAENYIISNENVAVACDINRELAWKMGRYRTAQTWKIIGMFYTDEPIETDIDDNQSDKNIHADNELDDRDLSESDSNSHQSSDSTTTTTSGDYNGFEAREEIVEEFISQSSEEEDSDSLNTSTSLHIAIPSSPFNLRLPWKHESVVMELLDYYTEQGDVQMCVTLFLVLEKYLHIDNNRIEDWFTAYIDMLHRFKLWSTATAIIKACKIQNVRERNESATTINIACSNCFKLVMGTSSGSWACDKCHKLLNPCTICHQTVRGLYVWCQGCNHGGHIAHLRDWFATEKLCATGCGHTCVLQPLMPPLQTDFAERL